MPLAPAHPAVVLPLQRLGLPLSALVMGALAPDVPVYLPVGVSYRTTLSGPGVAVDVAVGAGSHVLWDTATHDWGFLVHELAFLREEYGAIPLYGWLQHSSTVAGSVVVAAYGVRVAPTSPQSGRASGAVAQVCRHLRGEGDRVAREGARIRPR